MGMSARPASSRRLHWLDGVRGGAALFVVLHHMWLAAWPYYPENRGPWWLGWLLYGHLAVAVFIVVSGYSLALAPLRHGGELVSGTGRFIRRRAMRILPAYWTALVFSTVLFVLILEPSASAGATTKGFLVHATLLQDVIGSITPNGAFWSIAVEWQIYFVFPLILLLALRTRMTVAVALTTIGVIAAHMIAQSGSVLEKINHLTPQFLALFAFGVLAAWATHNGVGRAVRRGVGAVVVLALIGFVALAASQGSPWMTNHWFSVDLLFGSAVAGAMLLTATSSRPWRERSLGSRPAVALGAFSYSLYLVHAPLVASAQIAVLGPMDLSPMVNFALLVGVVLPIVLLLSYAFFRAFEQPFLNRRDLASLRTLPAWQLVSRRGRRPAAAPARVAEEPAKV